MPSGDYTHTFYEGLRDGVKRSADVIAPLVLQLFPVRSVIDIGCGEGAWLAAFKKFGVGDVLGIDGDHVNRKLLQIPPDCFQVADLSMSLRLARTFDLAVCLEVAEHLPADCASAFVDSLVRLAPVVLFSAAIPFQGGVHHVNEQWPDKWAALFNERGYLPVDCIRSRVWQNDEVEWWYAQNVLLFVHASLLGSNTQLKTEFERTNLEQLRLVHPRNYLEALVAIQPPCWTVRAAFQLLRICAWNAFRRRVLAFAGKKISHRAIHNPPNFNLALQGSTYYGIVKRSGHD